jgi:hypothetical protein
MIIGLQGYAGSGKSTVAKYLEERHGFARRHIKAPIAAMTQMLLMYAFPEAISDLHEMVDGTLKRTPIPALGGRSATEIQQFLGTEFGRDFIHPDIWLDIWSAWAKQHPKVVQESVRFANEAERCDVIWEVRRPGYGALNGHVSEALPDACPGAVLRNDGTEADLFAQVDRLLQVYEQYSIR